MKCNPVQARLSAYRDGELRPALRGRIAGHLASCSACRLELEALVELDARLRSLPSPEPGVRFAASLMARLPEADPGPRLRLRPALVYACTFLLVFGLGLIWTRPASVAPRSPASSAGGYALQEVFRESQQLSLLKVQERTLLLIEEAGNE